MYSTGTSAIFLGNSSPVFFCGMPIADVGPVADTIKPILICANTAVEKQSATARKRRCVLVTNGSPCSIATTPARCTNTGEHDVLYSISLPRSSISGSGATIQPRRQPVIDHAFEKLLVEM